MPIHLIIPFLKKYWKLGAIAIVLFATFMAGKKWEEAKYARERARTAEAIAEAITKREQAIREQHRKQVEEDALARELLQEDLGLLRLRERDLLSQINQLSLVKPATQVVIEGCTEDEEIIANPFSDDFVRLWNESARPPTTD